MSVLHLLGSAGEGGAETYFVELVAALRAAGLEQACAIRANPGREKALAAAGVPVRTLGFGGPLDFLTRPGVAGTARNADARLLVAWMNRAARHAPAGPWARIGRLGGYYKLKNYRGFEALVANTQDIMDWVVAQGWPADRVRHIPNFAAAPEEVTPIARAELGTPENAPLLLGMGRLHTAKAHDVSLKALKALPEAYLWIAGAGALEDQLKALAQSLGVLERVRFLGWRSDASALYRAADVCVFPSRYEPLGNVVIQAWAHGLPVVAAASQGPAALIRDGEDGLLVPIDDDAALAERIAGLLADPMQRIRLIQNGHARVEAEFSKTAVVTQWRELFAQYGAA
ncbi:glycosyltransferase [Caulobacter sp. SLTY]|uniref:glycosyltransferase n=1 Tax=Caulobacter sp. SLTY TaxID=2683262 RepID=UPI001412A1B9|nr:glycosyltransferase [Caulobacter sp. SLTY]NBB15221.1 glycosyltransferase [Caulobacter sp. SLTY]